MVTRQELDEAIRECEAAPSSYAVCQKLATLYTVRDYLYGTGETRAMSGAAGPEVRREMVAEVVVGDYGESEFLEVIAGREAAAVWAVLDELMETLQVINPRLYDGVMRRLDR